MAFLGIDFKNFLNFRKGGYTGYNQSYNVGDTNPVYIDTSDLEQCYKSVPHLREVIDMKANLMSSLEWSLTDDEGNILDDKNGILTLLNNPNPLQGGSQFVKNYSISKSIYGNSFVYQNNGVVRDIPNSIWVLPARYLTIKPTGKMFNQTSIEDIIDYYKDTDSNQKYETTEIIHVKDCSNNLIKGDSKIETLMQPISNIKAALDSRNVLITNRGALGIISAETEKGIPLGTQEKSKLEEQYTADYGAVRGKKPIIITSAPVKWQSMVAPTKDLMLFEEVEESFSTIIDSYGLYRDLFSSTKGATFENQKEALIASYQNTIIPEANELAEELMNKWNTREKGIYIVPHFDIPALKESEVEKSMVHQTNVNTIISLLDRGLITDEEAKLKLDL